MIKNGWKIYRNFRIRFILYVSKSYKSLKQLKTEQMFLAFASFLY